MIGGALLSAGKYINGLIPNNTVYDSFTLPYSGVYDITAYHGNLITLDTDEVRVHAGMTGTVDQVFTTAQTGIYCGICVANGDLIIMRDGELRRMSGISNTLDEVMFTVAPFGAFGDPPSGLAFDGTYFIVGGGNGVGAPNPRYRRYDMSGTYIDGFVSVGTVGSARDAYGVSWTGKYYVAHANGTMFVFDDTLTQVASYANSGRWLYAQNGRRAVRIERTGSTVEILEND